MNIKETKIELTNQGEFRAVVHGRTITTPSLKAMKGRLDAMAKKSFEPFVVLTEMQGYGREKAKTVPGTDLSRTNAIAVEKNNARWKYGKLSFRVVAGSGDSLLVDRPCYRDCKGTIDTYKKLQAHRKKTQEIKYQRQKEEDKLRAALHAFALDPEQFVATK